MAQQNINTGTLPNDKTGDSLRTAMIKVQNNFSELYTTAPISNSVNVGDATSNVTVNSTAVFIGNSGTYTLSNSTVITTTTGRYSQVLNSGANNLVIGTTNATSVLVYTNGITSANLRAMVAANGNVGIGNGAPNELLTVGGTMSANQVIIGNTSVNFTINATFIPATANYALSANTSNYIGSLIAANVVSNAQLQANLANYTNTAGLTSYVAGATANNTSFVGSVTAANVVSNAQLSANISGLSSVYQTMSGLSANVATLTANNTSFVGSVSAANVVSNTQLSANISGLSSVYQTMSGLSANVATLTSNNATYAFGKTEGNLNVNNATTVTNGLYTTGGQTISGGFVLSPYNLGTQSGTLTPSATNGNYQYITTNGSLQINNPTSDCAIDILFVNGASSGSVTFSGFTAPSGGGGDTYASTDGLKFLLSIRRLNSISTYVWKALQ